MSRSSATVGTAVGVAVAAAAAAAAGIPARDAVILVGISFGVATATYLLGRTVVPATGRRRGIAAAATVVALVPIAGTAAGMLVAARAMFVSSHDLAALAVIVTGAGTAGVVGALAMARELTVARRDAEHAAARAAQLERGRRELVAWVSHDLRTPMAGIRAMVEALEDGVVDDGATVDRYHRQVREEVERLAALVDDLFELSRIDADALHLTFEAVSLDDVVADAVAGIAAVAWAKDVRIDEVGTADSPAIQASTRELTRVVRNLLDNAIRHTPAGGAVSVGVEHAAGVVVVSVRDECGGIPDDEIERVFDLAYRGDTARTSAGSGLGLAIARGFVEAHQGEIDVRNLGDGCCFEVTLPRSCPTPSPVRGAR